MTVKTHENAKVVLSVVIPCLNEEETLAICIEKAQKSFRDMNVSGEVVIADNGSTDNSKEIAIQLGAIVVDVPVRGYGAALLAGFQASRGEYIIMGDADDSYALDSLSDFYNELRLGASLVMGDRFAGGIEKGAMPHYTNI
jgi:glycosyltransferase involved in cell wall biosynthesis